MPNILVSLGALYWAIASLFDRKPLSRRKRLNEWFAHFYRYRDGVRDGTIQREQVPELYRRILDAPID